MREVFDLRPAAIVRDLDLLRPIYRRTAAYGHFGREDKEFTWEHTPRVDDLKRALSGCKTGQFALVVPDLPALRKQFVYSVPEDLAARVQIGTQVAHRRTGPASRGMGGRADRFCSVWLGHPADQSSAGDRPSGVCRETGGMGILEMGGSSAVLAPDGFERKSGPKLPGCRSTRPTTRFAALRQE